MSKMGRLNFELQEQAEELGFETVQEALDNGCVVGTELFGDAPRLIKPIDMQKLMDEQEQAHKAWLKEKEEVLKELESLLTFNKDAAHTTYELSYMLEKSLDKVKHAIDFIEKGEV